MDNPTLTKHVVEHGEMLARHDSDIQTLFRQQDSIEKLTDSTHKLAISVGKLTDKVAAVDERLDNIEGEKRQKGFAIWQIVMSAVLGGAVTYLVTMILGGG